MRFALVCVVGLFVTGPTHADVLAEAKTCASRGAPEARIAACNRVIKNATISAEYRAGALAYRSAIYSGEGKYEAALRDVTEALRLYPNHVIAYAARCKLNVVKGEYQSALSDCNRAHEINRANVDILSARAGTYYFLGDYQTSITDASTAITLKPEFAEPYRVRGRAHIALGHLDQAIADSLKANALEPVAAGGHINMGLVYAKRGRIEEAIAAFSKAATLSPTNPEPFAYRSELYLQAGRREEAVRDARQVLALPAHNPLARDAQIRAAELMTKLSAASPSPVAAPGQGAPAPSALSLQPPSAGPRIALVIGNSNYVNAGALKNPSNDARLIAGVLRKVGFTEVKELYDLSLPQMVAALKEFGDRASAADWAVVYYAGHGMEMGGIAYLLPIDVRLLKDTHVQDETVSVDRVLEKVDGARNLKLVILDACRNNPFVAKMLRSGTGSRAISAGLPALEPEGNVMVAYATKHGTTASDGDGDNGPYALALAEHIPTPTLDVRVMFGRVRDAVRRATRNQQDPYTYGSIGGDLQYFAVAAR